MDDFATCWEGLEDPRCGNAQLHDFHELLLMALCAVLSGGQGAADMALFAKSKEVFLRGFLTLKNGVPSHDTFSRLFRQLDPEQFGAAFRRFMAAFSQSCEEVVAIDGKVLRRSFDRASGKSALHMVSAWAELAKVPPSEAWWNANGGVRATDGAGAGRHRCQIQRDHRRTGLAENAVIEGHHRHRRRAELPANDRPAGHRSGRRLLSGPERQPGRSKPEAPARGTRVGVACGGTLHDDVKRYLDDPNSPTITAKPTVDGDHGRIETRTATISTAIGWLQDDHCWPGLKAIGKITHQREIGEKITTETAYYVLSTAVSPDRLNEVARFHWGGASQRLRNA